jgi:hypothetical protein
MAEGVRHGSWWTEDKPHGDVAARLSFLTEQNQEMRLDNLLYLNIASNWNPDGSGTGYGPEYWRTSEHKIRRNICASGLDTAASLMAANRTIPSYQTTNGNFKIARRAMQRARVIHAQMWQLKAFNLGIDAFYDGGTCGTGATHGCIDPRTGLPKLVRVMPNSLFVDAAEGREPRSLYWVHFRAREVLQGNYPKNKHDLEGAKGPSDTDFEEFFIRRDNCADLVKVIEAWHLPSKPDKSDGRHVITTSTCTLVDEKHARDRFPFSFYHYALRRAGFFGQGLVERLLPAQLRISELQAVIRRCQDLGSNVVWLVPENCNVQDSDITNLPGAVITFQGPMPPQQVIWSGTPMDLKQEINDIAGEAFEQEGLSPGMVGGELVQKGLNSARAVRAADDVSSRRQIIPTRALEDYYLQTARLIEDLNDDCVKLDKDYVVRGSVRVGRQQFLTSSKWAELAIPEGDCTLTVMSMSATPTTPQGRMAAVQEYIDGGFMSRPVAISMMEFPDVDPWQALETANLDLIVWQIDSILDMEDKDAEEAEGPVLPIPNQDMEMARRLMNSAYLVAYRMKAPVEIQDAMLNYIAYADERLEEAAAAQAPPPEAGAPPGAEGAPPGPMPGEMDPAQAAQLAA